ncbi:MAG: DUF4199 domain-containing protein [Gemmatimonadales bacterium]|nr:DUF4199 domain-containing protein [Gemmatimonadales bacterium]
MQRVVLRYGLIAGTVLALLLVLTFVLLPEPDFENGQLYGYTGMVVAFLMVFFGIRAYRDQQPGPLSFGRAFRVGALITGVATLCYVATWEVIYWKFAPDFADKYAAYALEKARKGGASDAELAKTKRELDDFKVMYDNPLYNAAITFLEPLPVGLVMTLVAASMLRTKEGAGG